MNGYAFIEGLLLALCCQPVVLCAECADDFISHTHASVVLHLASIMGFKQVWNKVVPLHSISPQNRTRWLATWIRADVKALLLDVTIKPSISPRPGWTDDAYRFVLPRSWTNQMILSDTENAFYADAALLPPAKRRCLGANPSAQQVLFARLPADSDPLPTLCAAYTEQHNLSSAHIADKGIFASLQMLPEGFAFFDPATFVVLLGATSDLVLPVKLGEAFRGIGNAIAIPHALLPLLIGFQSILSHWIDILGLI